jgi:hypothetical protein
VGGVRGEDAQRVGIDRSAASIGAEEALGTVIHRERDEQLPILVNRLGDGAPPFCEETAAGSVARRHGGQHDRGARPGALDQRDRFGIGE